ncbi:MAG: DUF2345 domain-containing protein, partial [Zoogloeaceae bacterium]|nr:DUF2345 domain-containing protein [Zoogloeaceae bacterium]
AENIDTLSHRDTQQSTARRWIHNAGKKISLFVHGLPGKINLRLITAKGHARLWAQDGDVEIVGEQNIRIHANKGRMEAAAKEELIINCGGATVQLKGGNIDISAPGHVSFKAGSYGYSGPASLEIPFMPSPDFCLECFLKAIDRGLGLVKV